VEELTAEPPPTKRLAGGSYDKPLEEVPPGFLSVLFPAGGSDAQFAAPHPRTSGRRTALARWLTDPANPLPARVMVNRIWQGHFGRGLVANANDFGTQTPPPSHPHLLDWLAAEFVNPKSEIRNPKSTIPLPWSLKSLHRLLVTSSAYRQATGGLSGDLR